ncbi:hypothetical protein SCP_0307280 [Sparassis crispa]|uniref:Zn(2)-C6 fungal-type domain-containing protein n=1 Tax=Sparassis crispa TaxID=139825 RepID=A0A401GFV3_9APHY|nr:hypothetical protein SCP_0307280 [Sparassis crispa]GBE81005.1 hypothetical protein SCP_0307280 [Sparassis crispa]
MQTADIHSWAAEPPTTVIDLEEHDLHYLAVPSNTSQSYYAVDTTLQGNKAKKRKVERACDFCRRRKTRCDGSKMPNNICTNCLQNRRTCTYIEGSKPRGPPKAYITSLEDRVEKMEALLKRLRPEADFSVELGLPVVRDSWKTDSSISQPVTQLRLNHLGRAASVSSSRTSVLLPLAAVVPCPSCPPNVASCCHGSRARTTGKATSSPPALNFKGAHPIHDPQEAGGSAGTPSSGGYDTSSSYYSSDHEEFSENLIKGMAHLTVRGLRPAQDTSKDVPDSQRRFHGKSNTFLLVKPTRAFKQQHMDELTGAGNQEQHNPTSDDDDPGKAAHKRPFFWNTLPWEIQWEGADRSAITIPPFIMSHFPPSDLANSLINIYLTHKNPYFPLLHRPTFERQWNEGLYKRDLWFACVCMAIFGVASRYSDDPRVLPKMISGNDPPDKSDSIWSTAGWKYIEVAMDVHRRRRSILIPPDLFEIQTFVIIANYLRGSLAHPESWTHIAIGIRKAQDVGAHRRKVYGRKPTVEDELWKRAYWHLVAMDRIGSMFMGRPCSSREEDLDLDMPLEVDDEYWENEDPDLAFQQPPGTPSKLSAFIWWIKLSQIVAFAMRTLYAIGRSKEPLGLTGPRWREETVARLNDAMFDWVENLPNHLRWSNNMENPLFAGQAATLYSQYYLLQITIYRPFIPVPRALPRHLARRCCSLDGSDGPLSALSICVNAATAGAQILQAQANRSMTEHINAIHVSFVFAGVLLVNFWTQITDQISPRSRRSKGGESQSLEATMDDILKLVEILEGLCPKWELAKEACEDIKAVLPPPSSRIPLKRLSPSPESDISASYDRPPVAAGYSMEHPYTQTHASPSVPNIASTSYRSPYGSPAYAGPSSHMPAYTQSPQGWQEDEPQSFTSRYSGWHVPEAYPLRDEWLPSEPQVALRQQRSVSHVRSTNYYPAFAAGYLLPYVDSGPDIMPTGGVPLHEQHAAVGMGARENQNSQVPYIKREYMDDGQEIRLYQSYPGTGMSPAPSGLPRHVRPPSYEEQTGQWNMNMYRRPHQWHNGSYPT